MKIEFSPEEVKAQFRISMVEMNAEPDDRYELKANGQLQRYHIKGDKQSSKNGAYVLHMDGYPAGFIQNWKGEKISWKFNAEHSSLTQEQREYLNSPEYQKEIAEKQRQQNEERRKLHEEAAEQARIAFESYIDSPEIQHPYLKKKNVKIYGARFNYRKAGNPEIAVPLYNIDGNIQSLQWIDKNGNKRFYPCASTSGAFFHIGLDSLKDGEPILICEGFATGSKIHQLTELPTVCAMNCDNVSTVTKAFKTSTKYKDRQIIIMTDNDIETAKAYQTRNGVAFNPGINAGQKAVEAGNAIGYIAPPFNQDNPEGSDWDDYALAYGDEKASELINEKIKAILLKKQNSENENNTPEKLKKILTQVEEINAQELRTKEFPPIVWAVEGFIPSGLSVLAGSPKVGKSRLALHLALGVAIGGCVLGKINVEQGNVLYLALEDTQRRLQERINNSGLPNETDLSKLSLITQIPRQHEGGLEYIRWWLETHRKARLVIVDTMQKFRKQLSGKNNMYSEDYDTVSEMKNLADEFDVPLLLIHHLKKATEEDWLNELSGSQGIAGAADTIFVLRRKRTDSQGILHRTGRDVEETDFNMELDEEVGWVLGDEVEPEKPKLSIIQQQIVDYLTENGLKTPQAIAKGLGISLNTVRGTLRRLLKKRVIEQNSYGSYSVSTLDAEFTE